VKVRRHISLSYFAHICLWQGGYFTLKNCNINYDWQIYFERQLKGAVLYNDTWEADGLSTGQDIPRLSSDIEFHYSVDKKDCDRPIWKLVHTLILHLFKLHFNNIPPFTIVFLQYICPLSFQDYNTASVSHRLSSVLHVLNTAPPTPFPRVFCSSHLYTHSFLSFLNIIYKCWRRLKRLLSLIKFEVATIQGF
jgi:hypothetical protein